MTAGRPDLNGRGRQLVGLPEHDGFGRARNYGRPSQRTRRAAVFRGRGDERLRCADHWPVASAVEP